MRCHAAEPGAVTSLRGLHNPGCSWRAGRSVGFREEAARAPRGAALRTGRKGERNTSPGSRCESTRPVRKNGPVLQNTAVERRLACALRHWARTPRQACLLPGCADRRSAPSLLSRDGEKDTKVRPGIAATGWRSYGENQHAVSCPAKAGHPVITAPSVFTGSPACAGDDSKCGNVSGCLTG